MQRIAAGLLSVFLLLGSAGDGIASPPAAPKGAQANDASIAVLRQLLNKPEGQIDLARAKVAIDHMVDPNVDVEVTLRELDQWAAKVRARIYPGASNRVKTDFLLSTLYEPGAWNDYKPFSYDYSDPTGATRTTLCYPPTLPGAKASASSCRSPWYCLGKNSVCP